MKRSCSRTRCIRRTLRELSAAGRRRTSRSRSRRAADGNGLNIHGAIDLETGNTRMLEVLVVNAASTIMLLMAIEAMYPGKRLIHVFLDNARYHHAKLVQQWLARSGCRIRLHFIPSYCPHLDPIERLWGLMHRHYHPQQMLRQLQGFQSRGTDFSAREGAEELACLLRPGHRQLPHHRPRKFSGSRLSRVYKAVTVIGVPQLPECLISISVTVHGMMPSARHACAVDEGDRALSFRYRIVQITGPATPCL